MLIPHIKKVSLSNPNKICPGIAVIGQDADVLETMLLCISGEDGPLVCDAVALAVQ